MRFWEWGVGFMKRDKETDRKPVEQNAKNKNVKEENSTKQNTSDAGLDEKKEGSKEQNDLKDTKNAKEYEVGGYKFSTKEAAKQAKEELKSIKYLASKTDTKNPKQVYQLYNAIIEKEFFSTLIGLNYLKNLQQILYVSKEIPNEKIQPIPINTEVKEIMEGKREVSKHLSRINQLEREKQRYKDKFVKSMIANVLLIVAIIVIVFITIFSAQPTIFNYENNLINKYSTWEEELQKREDALKVREKELNK